MVGREWNRKLARLAIRGLVPAFALAGVGAGDRPAPDAPAPPFAQACPDRPDAGDYRLGRDKRFSLLPPLQVVVTGYSSTPEQTDSTPYITASMTHVRRGVIALSRDLIRSYNPKAPFNYGDHVMVEGVGVFVVEDTMHRRHHRRADIWFPTTDEAMRWGRKTLRISHVRPQGEAISASGSVQREASAPTG